MQNVLQTVVSQYQNSPTLLALIQDMDAYIDPSVDIQAFYDYCWNVDTAQGFGLDLWGRIVGVGRTLEIPADIDGFGFNGQGVGAEPFGQGVFNGGANTTQTYSLSDDAYRTLILVKAASNISNCTVRSMNALLQLLFAGYGRCYVQDYGQMQMGYVFEFPLSPVQRAIVINSGALPRAAGVQALLVENALGSGPTFGFNGSGAQPFGQGVFYSGGFVTPIN